MNRHDRRQLKVTAGGKDVAADSRSEYAKGFEAGAQTSQENIIAIFAKMGTVNNICGIIQGIVLAKFGDIPSATLKIFNEALLEHVEILEKAQNDLYRKPVLNTSVARDLYVAVKFYCDGGDPNGVLLREKVAGLFGPTAKLDVIH